MLSERLPITQPQHGLRVTIGAPMMQSQPLRMLDRGRTESVVIGPEAIVVENTSYRCYEDFCALLEQVLEAVSSERIAGFTRTACAISTSPGRWHRHTAAVGGSDRFLAAGWRESRGRRNDDRAYWW
jgi:hypothetical protein